MSGIDLSKLEEMYPGFKLFDGPIRYEIFGGVTGTSPGFITEHLELKPGEREFNIRIAVLPTKGVEAKTIDLVFPEKEVVKLYSLLTHFLLETVKRAKGSGK